MAPLGSETDLSSGRAKEKARGGDREKALVLEPLAGRGQAAVAAKATQQRVERERESSRKRESDCHSCDSVGWVDLGTGAREGAREAGEGI